VVVAELRQITLAPFKRLSGPLRQGDCMLGRFTKNPPELVLAPNFPHQTEPRARSRRAALVRFMSDI